MHLSELKTLALQIRTATREQENTAQRIGTLFAELVEKLQRSASLLSYRFEADKDGVRLLISSAADPGQHDTLRLTLPLLSAEAAGIVTPEILNEWIAPKVATAKEELLEIMAQNNREEALRFDEERRAIEQILESSSQGRGVYVLKNVLSPQSLELLRSRFPHLTIKNPSWTGFAFYQRLPLGCFTQNMENLTGYGTAQPLSPSGHLSAIIDRYDRVFVKRKGGKVYYTKARQISHYYFADGTMANLHGPDGELFLRLPHFWYKGVSDYFFGVNYFFVASERPEPAQGVRIREEQLQRFEGKSIGLSDSYHRLEEALVDNSSTTVWRVSVSGYRFATFPSSAFDEGRGKIYGTMFFDRRGIRCGHTVAPIGPKGEDVGFRDGMRFYAEIPEGAVEMYFTLPTAIRPEWVWLTKSEEIYDREPECFESPETFVAVLQSSLSDGVPSSTYPQTASPTTFATAQEQARALGEGWGVMTYDTYNMLVNLQYAINGERLTYANGGNQWNDYSFDMLPTERTTVVDWKIMRGGQQTWTHFLLGISGASQEWLAGIRYDAERAAFVLPSRSIDVRQDISEQTFQRVLFGARADNIALLAGGSVTTYLGCMQTLGEGSALYLSPAHWVTGCFSYATTSGEVEKASRLQYIGAAIELSTDDYKAL